MAELHLNPNNWTSLIQPLQYLCGAELKFRQLVVLILIRKFLFIPISNIENQRPKNSDKNLEESNEQHGIPLQDNSYQETDFTRTEATTSNIDELELQGLGESSTNLEPQDVFESDCVQICAMGTKELRRHRTPKEFIPLQTVSEDVVINFTENSESNTETLPFSSLISSVSIENLAKKESIGSIKLSKNSHESRGSDAPFVCRICYETEAEFSNGLIEKPVYACRCRGTVGLVHLSCLQKWLTISQTARCELCHYEFPTQEIMRYGRWKSFRVWFNHVVDKAQLIFDICAWLVMTPIIAVMLGLAFVSRRWLRDVQHKFRSPPPAAHYVIIVGMTTLVLIGCCAYIMWHLRLLWSYFISWYRFYHGPSNKMVILTAFTEPVQLQITPTPYTISFRPTPIEVRMQIRQQVFRELEKLEIRSCLVSNDINVP